MEIPCQPTHQACQILGVKWKEASAEEKALCEAEAERDRIRFNSEVAAAGMSSARGTQAAPKEPFKPFVVRGRLERDEVASINSLSTPWPSLDLNSAALLPHPSLVAPDPRSPRRTSYRPAAVHRRVPQGAQLLCARQGRRDLTSVPPGACMHGPITITDYQLPYGNKNSLLL